MVQGRSALRAAAALRVKPPPRPHRSLPPKGAQPAFGADLQAGTSAKRLQRRALVYQLLTVAVLLAVVLALAYNTAQNLRLRGIPSGFDFLAQAAGFDIGDSLIAFAAGAPYWQALLVGLVNTLRVALPAMLLTALIGTVLGLGRLSRNFLLRSLCGAYVETFRNIPLLLQLLAWYFVLTDLLPPVEDAWRTGTAIFLSKSGLAFPIPIVEGGRWLLDLPRREGFGIGGGGSLTPEFLAVLLGLVFYSAAYFAETVRAGFNAVPLAQKQAAAALGLTRFQALVSVTLPQALRLIMPPAANQFLSLTKNSSLAIAVGYPDLVSVANTTLNQTGRAVECVSLIMLVYLCLSLATSLFMHWAERRMAW